MHRLITLWFTWVHDWGYLGIVLLMAMESTILPVPSELVIPPAAYWAAQGRFTLWGVVLAGTVGSVIGAGLMYWAARAVGRPLIVRYGPYLSVTEGKLQRAERWLARYEAGGVFFARLLPVVRHLIGIPAGIVRMPVGTYLLMTTAGSALWCTVLAWFGAKVIGDQPRLLDDPEQMILVLKSRALWFVGLVVVLCALYLMVVRLTAKSASAKT
jgi:membrane protein DedA with SNARE-associated domain